MVAIVCDAVYHTKIENIYCTWEGIVPFSLTLPDDIKQGWGKTDPI